MVKSNPLLLHIESSSTVCSIGLSKGSDMLSIRETDNGFTHAENLVLFIKEACSEAGLKLHEIDGVSVSKGPGSYTGLRIGVATAKGICYSLSKPLISVDTLQSMAYFEIKNKGSQGYFCPMMDARRMEIYCTIYNESFVEILPVQAMIINEQSLIEYSDKPFLMFGDGAQKCKEVLPADNFIYIADSFPSATKLLPIALKKFNDGVFEDIAYFEPFYLKEFIGGKKKGSAG